MEEMLIDGFSVFVGVVAFFLILLSRGWEKEQVTPALREPEVEVKSEVEVEVEVEPEVKSEEEQWVLFVEAVTGCSYEDIAQHEHYESRFPPVILSDFGDLRLSREAISWGLDELVAREMKDASLWVISRVRDW
jgi:hypothetical protein